MQKHDLQQNYGYDASGPRAFVFVIENDLAMGESIRSLLQSVGLGVRLFGSAREFLQSKRPDAPACLVLEVRLPGESGLDLQLKLAQANISIPVIFVTQYGDIPMTVRAMKAGAVEFLLKPFRSQDLLDAVWLAIEQSRAYRDNAAVITGLWQRYSSLTAREREVMGLVVIGRMNKQIADELEVCEATVKVHRGQVMRKMRAKSLVDLVRIADKLGMSIPSRSVSQRRLAALAGPIALSAG